MKDYEELITELRKCEKYAAQSGIPVTFSISAENLIRVANTIEQLAKERDAAVAELRKEADNCKWCKWWKHKSGFVLTCANPEPCCVDGNPDRWEWRGVQ